MKVELYKKNIESFKSTKTRDRTDLTSNHNIIGSYSSKHPYFQFESLFQDEKTFKENFANPQYNVEKEYAMVVVEKTENKVSLKLFYGYKVRRAGVQWFKTSKNCQFLTANLKTGNIYQGSILNYQKKKGFTRKIRCNFFSNNPLNEFQNKLKGFTLSLSKPNETDFYVRPIFEFIKEIDSRTDYKMSPNLRLFKFYLDKKNIKYPNNFSAYIEHLTGPHFKKVLKENKNKLVDSVMQFYNLRGDKVKKALHEVEELNIIGYKRAKNLFGEDWINQDDILVKELLSSPNTFDIQNFVSDSFKVHATKKEKRNAFNLFKDYIINMSVDTFTLSDHFRFYVELKNYGDTEVVWKSDGSNPIKFREEHLNWSEKREFYRKGIYKRLYPEIYFEKIKEFDFDNQTYFPIVLTSSEEYNGESSMQSNCVRSYIGRPSALIISLRKASIDSEQRLTVEYNISKVLDKVVIRRVQTRGKFNSEPSSEWNQPLETLDKMVNDLSLTKSFQLYKLEKICSNDIRLESDTEFDEFGDIKWSYPPIDYNGSSLNFFI